MDDSTVTTIRNLKNASANFSCTRKEKCYC